MNLALTTDALLSTKFTPRAVTKAVSAAFATVAITFSLAGCGGGGGGGGGDTNPPPEVVADVAMPAGLGSEEKAASADPAVVPPYVDFAYTNQRGDARYATLKTNAGVRVVSGFLDLWKPSTELVDAGAAAPANGDFPAVVASTWSGTPGDASDGTKRNSTILDRNIQYVIDATKVRTESQATLSYYDDRRGKGYSIVDGLGPLTDAWRTLSQQTTTITSIPADAATKRYDDTGNNTGVGSATNTKFGTVVDFVNSPLYGSTEPAKRFFKYARPWRWSKEVVVTPTLESAKSTTPTTDGGYISGHSAEAIRNALMMGYVVPERYQELVSRAMEMGESRILAGMHSPLDVMSGRIQAQAVIAASLYAQSNKTTLNIDATAVPVTDLRATALKQARDALMEAAGTTSLVAFNQYAHSAPTSSDRFADYSVNQANFIRRATYGLPQSGDVTKVAVVPKAAELLIETRLPYLSADQRRVVLKTTAMPSGFPIQDDAEGWGRLNLFAAADGYGAFNGDVNVTMDSALGGFNAIDTWRNSIAGAGRLKKDGSGTLRLAGNNSFAGGTLIAAGTLQADSATAFGTGDVYVQQGTLTNNAGATLVIGGSFRQLGTGNLVVNLSANGQGAINVAKTAQLAGTLVINPANGFAPTVGSTFTVLNAKALKGTFTSVTFTGYKTTVEYNASGVQVRIDSKA